MTSIPKIRNSMLSQFISEYISHGLILNNYPFFPIFIIWVESESQWASFPITICILLWKNIHLTLFLTGHRVSLTTDDPLMLHCGDVYFLYKRISNIFIHIFILRSTLRRVHNRTIRRRIQSDYSSTFESDKASAQKTHCLKDIFEVYRIDNHIDASAVMTQQQLIRFISKALKDLNKILEIDSDNNSPITLK